MKGPRRAEARSYPYSTPTRGGLAYTRCSIRECYRSDLPLGIERKSRNRRSIGVQTCVKGQGTGGESKGCDPKKVPWGGGRGRWFRACLQRRQRAESLYVDAYLLCTSFLSTPKPDFQTHTTLFSLRAPCFSKATLRRNWSLSRGWGGCTRQSLPINRSSTLSPTLPCTPRVSPVPGVKGDRQTMGWGSTFQRGGCVGTGIGSLRLEVVPLS